MIWSIVRSLSKLDFHFFLLSVKIFIGKLDNLYTQRFYVKEFLLRNLGLNDNIFKVIPRRENDLKDFFMKPPKTDIIDGHVHIGKWPFMSEKTSIDSVSKNFKKYGIRNFLALPSIVKNEDPLQVNRRLLNQINNVKNKSKKVLFFYYITPNSMSVNDIDDLLDNIDGLKLHPSYSRVRINDDKMKPFLQLCETEQLPLLVHCGRDMEYSSYEYPLEVAKKYSFPLIIAHMGGPPYDLKARTLEEIKRRKIYDVYLETSTCFQPFLIKKAVEFLGDDKIIFGSDYPLYHPIPTLQTILMAGLDKRSISKILGMNFISILR